MEAVILPVSSAGALDVEDFFILVCTRKSATLSIGFQQTCKSRIEVTFSRTSRTLLVRAFFPELPKNLPVLDSLNRASLIAATQSSSCSVMKILSLKSLSNQSSDIVELKSVAKAGLMRKGQLKVDHIVAIAS